VAVVAAAAWAEAKVGTKAVERVVSRARAGVVAMVVASVRALVRARARARARVRAVTVGGRWRQWRRQLWWVLMAVTVAVVVVVVMGVGLAVALVRVRVVSGDEDNSSDRWQGPYNNQLKGPVEETTAAAMVTANDTATAMAKAMGIGKNNADDDYGASRTATGTTSPGCTSRLETSPLP
jgi:hypothetical protein